MSETAYIKNIPHSQVVDLAGLVQYQDGQVVSRTLAQNENLTFTLFAFEAGEGLSGHSAPGDAMVQVLEGEALITIADEKYVLKAGESIVMPAGISHALDAAKRFKMILTLVK